MSNNQNAFTAIRLLAACSVIATHSYVLLGLKADWLAQRGFPQLSELGVNAFFSISGYLICKSLQRNPDPLSYLRNRALRIFPGLFVMILITIFVVSPMSARSWNGHWMSYFENLSLYIADPFLDGVFKSNPVHVVNGSLWTLPLECTCYLMLLGMSWCGALNWRGTLLVFCAFYWMLMGDMMLPTNYFLGIGTFQFVRVGVFFSGGALLATMTIPNKWGTWLVAVFAAFTPFVLFAGNQDWHDSAYLFYLLFPFIVVFPAVRATKLAFVDRHDFSYGIYIYAWLIQQLIVEHYGIGMRPIVLSTLTIAITAPIAALSWLLVEKPALTLRSRVMPSAGTLDSTISGRGNLRSR